MNVFMTDGHSMIHGLGHGNGHDYLQQKKKKNSAKKPKPSLNKLYTLRRGVSGNIIHHPSHRRDMYAHRIHNACRIIKI